MEQLKANTEKRQKLLEIYHRAFTEAAKDIADWRPVNELTLFGLFEEVIRKHLGEDFLLKEMHESRLEVETYNYYWHTLAEYNSNNGKRLH